MESSRVLIVHSYGMEGSGSSTYTRGLAAGLLDAGHQVVVAAYRHRGDEGAVSRLHGRGGRFESLPAEALAVTYPRAEIDDAPMIAGLSRAELDARRDVVAARLRQLVARHRPDRIVANHYLIGAAAAVQVGAEAGIPVVVVSHGTDIEYAAARSEPVREQAREIAAAAAVRIALTATARQRIAEVLGLRPDSMVVIPPGICEGCTAPFTDRERAERVAFVGRLLLDKGPHLVIAALADALAEFPAMTVSFIGDGPDREPLEELIAALDGGDEVRVRRVLMAMGSTSRRRDMVAPAIRALFEDGARRQRALAGRLAGRVEFQGYVSTIVVGQQLIGARLVVLPSLAPECFPLVLLEGMSMGCAVAATPLGGTTDLLADATAEFPELAPFARIDVADPVAGVADALRSGVRGWNPGLARRFSRFAKTRYRWSSIGERLVDVAPSEGPVLAAGRPATRGRAMLGRTG